MFWYHPAMEYGLDTGLDFPSQTIYELLSANLGLAIPFGKLCTLAERYFLIIQMSLEETIFSAMNSD